MGPIIHFERRFLIRTAGLVAALVLASCLGDNTGPGLVHRARFSLAPRLDPDAARLVAFDSVHIVLHRPSDNSVAFDTTVAFPPNVDTLSLDLRVNIQGATEQFDRNYGPMQPFERERYERLVRDLDDKFLGRGRTLSEDELLGYALALD